MYDLQRNIMSCDILNLVGIRPFDKKEEKQSEMDIFKRDKMSFSVSEGRVMYSKYKYVNDMLNLLANELTHDDYKVDKEEEK